MRWARLVWAWLIANRVLAYVIAASIVLIVVVIAIRMYGNRRAEDALRMRGVAVADSVARVVRREYEIERDTWRRERDSLRIEMANVIARAEQAERGALVVQQRYANLSPQVVQQTPPQVLTLLEDYRISTDSLVAIVGALQRQVRQDSVLLARADSVITKADATIDALEAANDSLRRVKTPRKGFGYYVKEVGKYAIGGAVGFAVGSVVSSFRSDHGYQETIGGESTPRVDRRGERLEGRRVESAECDSAATIAWRNEGGWFDACSGSSRRASGETRQGAADRPRPPRRARNQVPWVY
jgi:hypothetical protein